MIKNRVLIGLVSIVLFASCASDNEQIVVEKQPLTVSVYASTTIQSKDQYKVYSTITGIIKQVFVEEGDTVNEDQPILLVENSNPSLNSENALLQLNLAKENYNGSSSRIETLQLQIDVAKHRAHEDSINYERQKSLWAQSIGSQLDLENRSLAFETSRNNYLQLVKQKTLAQKELQIAVRQAENNYQISLKNKGDFEIKSLMKGKLYALYKEVGELVNIQEPIALIGAADEYILEMEIDQQDIISVEIGQKVILKLDAFGKELFEATVSKINPLMNERSQTILVEATFDKPVKQLFPKMSGEANIIITEKPEVITIPLNYLVEDKYVIIENKEKKLVTTGLRSLESVEIIEGLNVGEIILKPEL